MNAFQVNELTNADWLTAFVEETEARLGDYAAAVDAVFAYFVSTYLDGDSTDADGLDNDPWALQAFAASMVLDDETLAAHGLI